MIDLAQKKIVRTVDVPREEEQPGVDSVARCAVSPDGKYLYLFRNTVLIFDTTDFKLVDKIELSKPQFPGMANVGLGQSARFDSGARHAGERVQLIGSSGAPQHFRHRPFRPRPSARFDFTPIGPSADRHDGTARNAGSQDRLHRGVQRQRRKPALRVLGVRSHHARLVRKQEFDGRARFSFGMSSTGKDLYIYGAGYTVEVFDAASMQLRNTIDLNADITSGMVVVPR